MNGLAPAHAVPLTGPSLDNRRVAAAVIDLAVIGAFGLLLTLVGGGRSAGTTLVLVGWALYYYFALESLTGQTLGKKAMNLKVVRSDGSDPDMRTIAVRTVLRLVDGIGAYVVGLIVMLVTGERRQRLGDLAADTVVTSVEESPFPESAAAPPSPKAPAQDPTELHSGPVAVPESAPAAAPEPAPAPEPEPELPPVPPPAPRAVPAPPVDVPASPVEKEEGKAPRMEIVSPIDLVMADDGEDSDGENQPPPPGGQAA
jgi:uncharacterized RDD family membrane protein YckC